MLHTAKSLRFHALSVTHYVMVMVLALVFHTKDPNGVGDAVNIFLLLDMSPSTVSEAYLLARRWDADLGVENIEILCRNQSADGMEKMSRL